MEALILYFNLKVQASSCKISAESQGPISLIKKLFKDQYKTERSHLVETQKLLKMRLLFSLSKSTNKKTFIYLKNIIHKSNTLS